MCARNIHQRIHEFQVVIIFFIIAGCSQEHINLSGQYKAEEKSVVDLAPIFYVVPVSICQNNLDYTLQQLRFPTTTQEREYTRTLTRFYLRNNTTNEYILEKRKDNYSAGSGIKYIVSVTRENYNKHSCSVMITFKRKDVYREGILTMAAPQFNSEDVLEFFKTVEIIFNFSILSKYSAESTYASFDRMLALRNIAKLEGKTNVKINNSTVFASIKVYPYRSGSMIEVKGTTEATEKNVNKLDFTHQIKAIKDRFISIAES